MTGDLLRRTGVAALGIPLLLFAAIAGSWPLKLLVLTLQVVMLREWLFLAKSRDARPFVPALLVAIAALDVAVFFPDRASSLAVGSAGVGVMLLAELLRGRRAPLADLGAAALFIVYVALPVSLWTLLASRSGALRYEPLGALPVLFVATWICDSAAYAGGRLFGKHSLYRAASPAKTVEGFIAGAFACALVLPAVRALGGASPMWLDYAMLPVLVGGAGQLGDLLESLMKRELGVKNSSSILPGHGGLLDRFDSLLLSTLFFFAYLTLTVV